MSSPQDPTDKPLVDAHGTTIHPERQKRVARALKFYSVMAIATGIWLLILVLQMILKYLIIGTEDSPSWFIIIGQVHGIFFIVYAISCLDLGTKARWEPAKWLTTILAGVVPFLSFFVEHNRRAEVKQEFQLK